MASEALLTPRQALSEADKSSEIAEKPEPAITARDEIPNQGLYGDELVTAIGVREVDTYEAAMIVVKASVVVDDEQQDTAQAGAASPMPSSPAPDQPQKSAPPKKGRVASPFRLFLISLIVIGVVVMLAQRKQVAGTPAPAPNSEADIAPVDTNPTESTAIKPPSGGHIF